MFTRSSRSIVRVASSVAIGVAAMAMGVRADPPHDIDLPARLLADTMPGTVSGMSSTSTFVNVDGLAIFRASSGVSGTSRLWRSSGRPSGTTSIPGTDGVSSDPVLLPGTRRVLAYRGWSTLRALFAVDLDTGVVETLNTLATNASTAGLIVAGSSAVFLAPVGGINTLWATNGTAAGTGPVIDPSMGTLGNVTLAGRYVYFTTLSAQNVYTLWSTDGSPLNSTHLVNLYGAPWPWNTNSSQLNAIGNRVLFAQPAYFTHPWLSEIWVSDGTVEGTVAVTHVSEVPAVLAFPNDGVGLYNSLSRDGRTELWRMSSVASECRLLMSFGRLTTFTPFGTYGSMTIFGDSGTGSYYQSPNSSVTLWVTDATLQSTLGVPGFPGVPANTSTSLLPTSVMAGDTLFLDSGVGGAGHEPWRLNLTTGELGLLRDIIPGAGSSNPNRFFPLDGGRGAGFIAYDTGTHNSLFISDGSTSGTRIVSHPTGNFYYYFFSPKSVGSRVFFVGSGVGYSTGFEPFAIDLCPADYNNSGAATAEDLFAYMQDWFAGSRDADMDNSGGSPDVIDLMGFFNTWMSGCPS